MEGKEIYQLFALTREELIKQLSDRFQTAELLMQQSPYVAEIILPQIASIVEKNQDPIILKCAVNLLEKTKDTFKSISKKPDDFFHKITTNITIENDVLRAFIFQILNVFVDFVHPELPVLKYVIDGCESASYETRLAAKKTAVEICKNYDYFCSQVLRNIRMPNVIDILPHITRSNNVINQTIKHINRNMNNENEYLVQLIDAAIEFSLNIDMFPTTTFKKLMEILHVRADDKKFINHVLKSMRKLKGKLLPYQEKEIFDYCYLNISNSEEKIPYFMLLSALMISDPVLYEAKIENGATATAFAEACPRTAETGEKICTLISEFIDDFANPKLFRRIITALLPTQIKLDTEYHAELSGVFKKLINASYEHQDVIGEFLMEITEEAAGCYYELISITKDISETLKLGFTRVCLLIGCDIEPQFAPADDGKVGEIAFSIGKYAEAIQYFGKKQGDLFYDAIKAFTDGEIAFFSGNYSNAALCYGQADAAFSSLGTMYTFHMTIANIRSLIASLLLQIYVMKQASNIDFTNYHETLYGVDPLRFNSQILLTSSVVLSPEIDEASHNAALAISEQIKRFMALLQEGNVNEMIKNLTEIHVIPRAMFCRDFPIEVVDIHLLSGEQIVPPQINTCVCVEFAGRIKNEKYKDAKILVSVANELGTNSPPTEIPSSGEFFVHEGVQLVRKTNETIYTTGIVVWFKAKLKNSDTSYVITSHVFALPIKEVSMPM